MINIESMKMPNYINPFVEGMVFDDSETYLEQIGKIFKKINEIVELYNQIEEDNKNYCNDKILKLDESLRALIKDYYNQVIKYSDDEDKKIRDDYNIIINDLDNRVNYKIDSQGAEIKKEMTDNYNDLNSKIVQSNQGVINPTNGQITTVQEAINSIYDTLRNNALTCSELDSLDFNADKFDKYELTAFQIDTSSKLLYI